MAFLDYNGLARFKDRLLGLVGKNNGIAGLNENGVVPDEQLPFQQANQNGTDVSVVTSGEKYIWNNKIPNPSNVPEGKYLQTDINGNAVWGDPVAAQTVVKRDTTANWNAKQTFIPMAGEIIIYTDHGTIQDDYGEDVNVPGIKIGDGDAYLIDLPFVGADVRYQILTELRRHTNNQVIHITQQEREFWNNKLNTTVNGTTLVLNRN